MASQRLAAPAISVIAAAGILAVIANIVAWWDWITGWYTHGWGNLITIAVSLLAVGVGACVNLYNFNRAREDGRNDKLRGEVAGLLSAVGRWDTEWEMMTNRALDLNDAFDPETNDHLIPLKAAFNETVGALYSEIRGRVYAIRMLTTDAEILYPAVDIDKLLSVHVADHDRSYELANDRPDSETMAEALAGMQQRITELPAQLQAAMDALLTNGTEKFAIMDRRR